MGRKTGSRIVPLDGFEYLVQKKLRLGYKKPEGTSLGLSKNDLTRVIATYLVEEARKTKKNN